MRRLEATGEEATGKCGKDENNEIQKWRGEIQGGGLEVEGENDRGGEGIKYLGYVFKRNGGQERSMELVNFEFPIFTWNFEF